MTPPDYTAKARELVRGLAGQHCVDEACQECVTVDREHAASDIAAALREAHERGASEERAAMIAWFEHHCRTLTANEVRECIRDRAAPQPEPQRSSGSEPAVSPTTDASARGGAGASDGDASRSDSRPVGQAHPEPASGEPERVTKPLPGMPGVLVLNVPNACPECGCGSAGHATSCSRDPKAYQPVRPAPEPPSAGISEERLAALEQLANDNEDRHLDAAVVEVRRLRRELDATSDALTMSEDGKEAAQDERNAALAEVERLTRERDRYREALEHAIDYSNDRGVIAEARKALEGK